MALEEMGPHLSPTLAAAACQLGALFEVSCLPVEAIKSPPRAVLQTE